MRQKNILPRLMHFSFIRFFIIKEMNPATYTGCTLERLNLYLIAFRNKYNSYNNRVKFLKCKTIFSLEKYPVHIVLISSVITLSEVLLAHRGIQLAYDPFIPCTVFFLFVHEISFIIFL